MSDETNEDRQNNELTALQAIYGDVVVDNREAVVWKVWRPLDLMLTLQPLHNSMRKDVQCFVTLHVKCCANYPDRPPKLAIHKMSGISTDNGTQLLSELEQLAATLCGEVCVYQLAQHAQQFLHDHYSPPMPSFYEQMVKQKTEQEQLKLQDLKLKESEERQKIQEEIQRRQEILRCAGRHRTHRSSFSQDNDSLDGQGDAPELVYYADKISHLNKTSRHVTVDMPCTCKNKGVQMMKVSHRNIKKVYIGNCLGHSSNGSTTYLAIDDDGERLVTKKWTLTSTADFQTRNRHLTSIQNNLKTMSKLNHHNLIPYVAMEICKVMSKKSPKQSIYLFRKFALGNSLKYIKKKLCGFSEQYEGLKLVRHVGLGVLTGLKELHSVGLSHRDVREGNVYLDDIGSVKLVGIDIDMTLSEMLEGDTVCERQSSAQDIYATGQMLLCVLSQEGTQIDIPPSLPNIAKDFFARCLTEDEYSQWSAEQLAKHSFLVEALCKTIDSKEKNGSRTDSEDNGGAKSIPQAASVTPALCRLHVDFEVLAWLGQGAFGDVLKVQNRLDGGLYAIKRIKLNHDSGLDANITREVTLLASLNHENVVRYFNAWIESTTEAEEVDSSENSKSPEAKKPKESLEGAVAKLGQGVKVEWSMTDGPVQKAYATDSDDSDDDESGNWLGVRKVNNDEASSGISFAEGSNPSETIASEDEVDGHNETSLVDRKQKMLYIQMEFCDKNTLRQAIDTGLYRESYRAWRLFREIVEGLAHVHQRGMMHRDLKPVNIFLDSNDHVKIGDFGLATKVFTGLPLDDKSKPEDMAGSLTGQIGTALYVAPEILQQTAKVTYNQKVDIYSLGIILFEMCHPRLDTTMERITVLNNLRSKEILFPEGFEKADNVKQIQVIRWLLDHDASARPTCAELLSSGHMPRAVPSGMLSGLLEHAMSQPGTRPYRKLVASCLDQRPDPAEDITYNNGTEDRPKELLQTVKDAVLKVFRSHGAMEFSPPLLVPRAKRWDEYPNAVKVMTASGTVCHLPHDLRLPLARHIAYSGIKYLRRYVVSSVYREKHVPGFHPSEIIECAFDIVTPKTDSLWSDAELLVVASRAAMECNLKVTIQLNHTELLKTLLLSCGVPLDKHGEMYDVLVDVKFGRINDLQVTTHLTSLCLPDCDVENLRRLMDAELGVHEVREMVTQLVKQAKWSKAVTQYITSLEAVYRNAKALGCECPITVAPFLAYNATQNSGIFWQMYVERNSEVKRRAKHRAGDLIAAGGRYDCLVAEFCKILKTETEACELRTCSIGFSLSLERMAAILKKMQHDIPPTVKCSESSLVSVCLWGTAGSGRDGLAAARRAQLARDLWAAGIPCAPHPERDGDHSRADVVVIDDDTGVRVLCRLKEYKMPYIDVIDFLKQQLSPDSSRSVESSTNNRSASWSEGDKSNSCTISVTFITSGDRIMKNSKRFSENQINAQITTKLQTLGLQPVLSRVRVNVLALSCESACVRMLSGMVTAPLDHDELEKEFQPVYDAFPKCRSILDDAYSELSNLAKQQNPCRSSDEIQLYALYSIPDSLCRLIT